MDQVRAVVEAVIILAAMVVLAGILASGIVHLLVFLHP
jgi:hypothetical protein